MPIARHLRVLDSAIEEDAMPGALKIAFASTDRRHVDQHFGSAKSFVMYDVDMDNATITDAVEFGELSQDGNEDKLEAKIEALSTCSAVYVQAIGGSAISKLARIGVQPMKVAPNTPINQLVGQLQDEIRQGPSAWIARALDGEKDATRFDAMEDEGWDE
ncbi:nitrogen fixation protein NifX [Magnetovibrio sp. PR-2]|uniref:nitrogen fixation protein NifX n=1 Tax=Magnetovibrio sp. PR-2 TaxID=3120356 RepID=UPI002FCE2AA1